MGFPVNFYQFNKRNNSTLAPGGDPVKTYECDLIDPTTVSSPRIRLSYSLADAWEVMRCNYAYIAMFSRYYFVSQWEFDGPFLTAHMVVDTLATYAANIKASSQFVVRSSSLSDGAVPDTLYPAKASTVKTSVTVPTEWPSGFSAGCFVVGIISGETGGVGGGVTYYAMTPAQFGNFKSYLFSDDWMNTDFSDLGQVTAQVFKAQFNPFQYVVSCTWFPVFPAYLSTVSSIDLGWWSIPVSASLIVQGVIRSYGFEFAVPKHPQQGRGNYLNGSPYSRYTLYFEPFGVTPIDPSKLLSTTTISASVNFDFVSGLGYLRVRDSDNNIIFTKVAQAGIPVKISQGTVDYFGAVETAFDVGSNMVGGVANLVFGGNASGLGAAIGGVGDMVSALSPQIATAGSQGSASMYLYDPVLEGEFYRVNSEDNARFGRPYMGIATLSDLSGYVECAKPTVNWACLEDERTTLLNYLQGGIYLE